MTRPAESGHERLRTEVLTAMARLGTDAGLLLDRSRRLLWASPNAPELLAKSVPPREPVAPPLEAGSPLALILDDPRAAELVGIAFEQGEIQRSEITHDGWRRVLRAVAAPMGSGPAPTVLLILSDITHERRLNRAHQDLLANLSHDLRTPLASLTLLADTLTGEARGDPEATQEFASRIATEAAHMHSLLSGILDLARLEAGAERANLEAVDLLKLVRRVCEGLGPQAKERRQTLQCSGEPVVARADSERLERALSNVLDNAIKFTGEGGRITVTVTMAGACPTVAVRDTGSGIPASALPLIFDRFYTGDRSRSGSGSGLGLAIARQAVELQGGRIEVSSHPGAGTEVRIQLCPPDPAV